MVGVWLPSLFKRIPFSSKSRGTIYCGCSLAFLGSSITLFGPSAPPRGVPGEIVTGAEASVLGRYFFVLSITVILTPSLRICSGSGRLVLDGDSDMDIAAELIGIRPLVAKLTAFAVSSFYCGVAGMLWAFCYLYSRATAYDINRSFLVLFMIIIGGLGSILAHIWALLYYVATDFLNNAPQCLDYSSQPT